MIWPLPPALDNSFNRDIAAFIRRESPSAHSDVATELTLAIQGLSGVKTFCPDLQAYAYFAAHDADGRIFAIACSQSHIAVRVGKERVAAAVIDGAEPAAEIGHDWVWFRTAAATQARLGRWCRAAYNRIQAR